MVNHPGIEKADFSSVLTMNSGAAYLPPELGEKMSSLVPKETYFSEGYGMSEAVCRLYPLFPLFPPKYSLSPQTIAAITQPYPGTLGGKLNPISGCTGILLPGMEALTFKDENGAPPADFTLPTAAVGVPTLSKLDGECALNEPGELWVRSGNVALGYWNNPKANADTFVRGWLRTGDRFRIDEGGNFWFADRAKVRFFIFYYFNHRLRLLFGSG
jgi:acyl-CoA synthetase (AMP-forming)/AMP-acid ligase II